MVNIDDIVSAIAGSLAKINEASPGLTKASTDSQEAASRFGGIGSQTPASHMTSAAAKLDEAITHLTQAAKAAEEAQQHAQAVKNGSGLTSTATTPASEASPATPGHAEAYRRPASFGHSDSTDYKKTFFGQHPNLEGHVWVHHAVEQQAQRRYPGLVSDGEMHSYENLRGIPKGDINRRVHLSAIRKSWNRFYKRNPKPTKQDLLDHATEVDTMYGAQFNPHVR